MNLSNYYMLTRHKIDIINCKLIIYGSPLTEIMTSSNHYINIQLAKFISSCFALRNILLSNQTNVT